MESSTEIEDRAAAWLAKRDSENWTESDDADLAAWLRASTAHRVAFLRLEAGWEKSERLKTFGVGAVSGQIPRRGRWQISAFFARRVPGESRKMPAWGGAGLSGLSRSIGRRAALGAAATVLLAIGTAAYIELHKLGDKYVTPIGGVASIPLVDGSQITLNTASRIRVALTENERRIELDTGEAYFNVAKDPARPFVVHAGNRRVIAVGTQFSVRRDGDRVDVIVTEGKVRVENTDTRDNLETPDRGTVLVAAGAIAHAGRDEIRVQTNPQTRIEAALSWRSGYLTFDETTLADAVAEFNRYNTRKIFIADPSLASLRINGKFRATNSGEFVQLLRNGFGVQTAESKESIRLTTN
jgi:transmembrane sensor